MKRSLDGGWAGCGVMIIWLMLSGYLMSGCAGIGFSLKAPTTQALTKTAAFLAGYEIGKSRPELAEEFIHYTQVDREDVVVLYDSWTRYLAYRLGADPVHRKLFVNMLILFHKIHNTAKNCTEFAGFHRLRLTKR